MTDAASREVPRASASQPMSRASALFIALLVTLGLGALSFWPRPTWAPPHRPTLHAPIVFDEFVNPPLPPGASATATDPAAH